MSPQPWICCNWCQVDVDLIYQRWNDSPFFSVCLCARRGSNCGLPGRSRLSMASDTTSCNNNWVRFSKARISLLWEARLLASKIWRRMCLWGLFVCLVFASSLLGLSWNKVQWQNQGRVRLMKAETLINRNERAEGRRSSKADPQSFWNRSHVDSGHSVRCFRQCAE